MSDVHAVSFEGYSCRNKKKKSWSWWSKIFWRSVCAWITTWKTQVECSLGLCGTSWWTFPLSLFHEVSEGFSAEETKQRAGAACCEHLLPRQSDLALVSARLKTWAPGVETWIQPCDCQGDELWNGKFITLT